MTCDMCDMYPDRIEILREAWCPRCIAKEPGHHHHILSPLIEIDVNSKEFKKEFKEWLKERS